MQKQFKRLVKLQQIPYDKQKTYIEFDHYNLQREKTFKEVFLI